MKTYIYRTIFIMLLISSYLTHSQIQPNKKKQDRNVKLEKLLQLIRNRGEFLSIKFLKI